MRMVVACPFGACLPYIIILPCNFQRKNLYILKRGINMGSFKQFFESSGIQRQDFSHLSKEDRLRQGKDIGEKFIINELLNHGVRIVAIAGKSNIDMKWKIDGYLNGNPNEPVQIKLRKTGRGGDDIAYELVLGFDPRIPVFQQLQNPRNQGRDYKGIAVKHYFVMNQSETEIYHIPAEALKSATMAAVQEAGGIINKPFRSSTGVELRPTVDNDNGNNKLMAFIPAESVATQKYTVGQGSIQPTVGANTVMSKKDFNIAAAQERLKALQAKQKADNELRKQRQAGLVTP